MTSCYSPKELWAWHRAGCSSKTAEPLLELAIPSGISGPSESVPHLKSGNDNLHFTGFIEGLKKIPQGRARGTVPSV